MSIKDEMPLLARHEGEWEGTYTFIDRDGNVTDRHRSHLTCAFPADGGEFPYQQTNHYEWDDGRTETINFPARYADKKIHFDTDRINGSAWEVDENAIVLTWVYKAQAGITLYELINLSPDGDHRARTWHWFKDGKLFQRTIINERRVRA